MNVACFKALSYAECCKMVSSQEQRVFIITHHFCNLGKGRVQNCGQIMLVAYLCTFWSRFCQVVLKIMCNDEYPLLLWKYHFTSFNSASKQATFIDNQNEYWLYYSWVQCYQWHVLHSVLTACYFSSEFTILNDVSFETSYSAFQLSNSLLDIK